jgi:hypothetical protein
MISCKYVAEVRKELVLVVQNVEKRISSTCVLCLFLKNTLVTNLKSRDNNRANASELLLSWGPVIACCSINQSCIHYVGERGLRSGNTGQPTF